MSASALAIVTAPELKIDLGCGRQKRDGFVGVDIRAYDGVDVVVDLARDRWPWDDNSVTEAYASHIVEHLDDHAVELRQTTRELVVDGERVTVVTHAELVRHHERCHFFNELHRVLKPSAKCLVITPHWASNRAYGDPTHVWAPVSEFCFYYLSAEWRKTEAPHCEPLFSCNFQAQWGYNPHPDLLVRAQDVQLYALANFKEAALDMVATLTKL